MKLIMHNQPTIGQEEMQAVLRVLQTEQLIAGGEVSRFEDNVKSYLQVKYAIAVNSGHAALHLSLLALGIQKNDEVIIPAYTVSDILNSIFYTGAIPILVDIEKESFTIDPKEVQKKITKKTKAIIVPHMFGFPAKIDVVKTYGIPVVEDAAQALGSTYSNKKIGTFGDLCVFSFYATKLVTTCQGGMIVTNDKKYFRFIKDLLDYNRPHIYRVRYNYALTDLAASIGNIQFEKLHTFIQRRKYIASEYRRVLDKKNLLYWPAKEDEHVNHFRFLLQFTSKDTRDSVQKKFHHFYIETIAPLAHFELPYILLEKDTRLFPHTEYIADLLLSIPLYPGLGKEEIARIIFALENIL